MRHGSLQQLCRSALVAAVALLPQTRFHRSPRARRWCGPCLMLAKELEAVAADMGDAVKILKVDCDEEEDLAQQLQIR